MTTTEKVFAEFQSLGLGDRYYIFSFLANGSEYFQIGDRQSADRFSNDTSIVVKGYSLPVNCGMTAARILQIISNIKRQ